MRRKLEYFLKRKNIAVSEQLVNFVEGVVRKARKGQLDEVLELPEPYTYLGEREALVRNLVVGMKLRPFIDR